MRVAEFIVNVTRSKPRMEGLHARNQQTTRTPGKDYANEGLLPGLFFESDETCEISYKEKKGSSAQRESFCRAWS